MSFFSHFNFSVPLNSLTLFGLTLLLGLIGGELAARSRFLPRISGYIAVGFLAGPSGLNIINSSVLMNAHIFVDISLSLILFTLGRHLDFVWLRRDKGLLWMSMAESGLTFALVFGVTYFLIGLPWLPAIFAATIAIATSAAVVMMVAHDVSSEGPVTRRALILTSLNNLFALTLFALFLPFTKVSFPFEIPLAMQASYQLFGSIFLGFFMFFIIKLIASLIGKHRSNQLVLFVGAVVCTMGLAYMLELSSMLALFMLGVAARNFDKSHTLMEVEFGWLARLFFILLFVVIGVYLQPQGLWQATGAVFLLLTARFLAKTSGVFLFAKTSRLTKQQTVALSLALCPMAGVAIGMSHTLFTFNPAFGSQLLMIIAAVVTVLNILGPIVTQFAFVITGEAKAADQKQPENLF
jgi:Kef-type K+ transport system membrane component KefB